MKDNDAATLTLRKVERYKCRYQLSFILPNSCPFLYTPFFSSLISSSLLLHLPSHFFSFILSGLLLLPQWSPFYCKVCQNEYLTGREGRSTKFKCRAEFSQQHLSIHYSISDCFNPVKLCLNRILLSSL